MKSNFFYTPAEKAAIKSIVKSEMPVKVAAENISKMCNISLKAAAAQYYVMRKKLGIYKKRLPKQEKNEITLPPGTILDFKPSKVTMEQGVVKLYL